MSAARTARPPLDRLQCAVSHSTCAPVEVKWRELKRRVTEELPSSSRPAILWQELAFRRWKDESERLSGENRGELVGALASTWLFKALSTSDSYISDLSQNLTKNQSTLSSQHEIYENQVTAGVGSTTKPQTHTYRIKNHCH